jgi:hypothetical protein
MNTQRFNPTVGLIKSWDTKKYQPYPVITDNLMNLELLFYVAQEFGNKEYYDIAISHLDRTAKDLIRVCKVLCTELVGKQVLGARLRIFFMETRESRLCCLQLRFSKLGFGIGFWSESFSQNTQDACLPPYIQPNGCAWHRANYNPETGELLGVTGTPQGLERPDTIWTRGQAWVIYGYTMAYRFTKDKKCVRAACSAFAF